MKCAEKEQENMVVVLKDDVIPGCDVPVAAN